MSTSPIASSDKIQTALTNLGIPNGFIAYDTVPLLRQLVVALGNVTTGGGSGVTGSGVVTGGGTIATGGFTFTVPATGTAALLGTANVFTTLQTITQANENTGILASTGYSLTGSNATNMIDLAGTWNTSGTPTALKLRITNTASNAASLLFDFGTNAASLATLRIDGAMRLLKSYSATNYHIGDATGGISWSSGGSFFVSVGACFASITSSEGLIISSASASRGLRFINGNADAGTGDIFVGRDAAGTLAQRNSTNAQTSRIYGTYTDTSNYTRLSLAATSTTMTIACETAGAGADDIDLTLTPAGTGVVQFGTHSAIAAETVTGYITIKDSGGTSRKIAVVS